MVLAVRFLALQQTIVADIEQERALVESNRQFIALMQAKTKAVVERGRGI